MDSPDKQPVFEEINLDQLIDVNYTGHDQRLFVHKIYKNKRVTLSNGRKKKVDFFPNSEGIVYIPIVNIFPFRVWQIQLI